MRFVRRRVGLALVGTVVMGVPPALGGVGDTPLPRFSDGKPAVLVLTVPGVMKRARLQTDFLCTALDSVPVDIGVEIFDADGTLMNDVQADVGAVLDVAPGRTVTVGTSATAAFLETIIIPLPSISQGSARVVATSARVRCNVMITDDALNPPVTLATLGEGVRPAPGPIPAAFPLPQFGVGRPATHSALIPGVVKRGRDQTDFLCTSLAMQNIDVGIQIFGPDGTLQNDVATGNGAVLDLAPGATVTFGTTGTAALLETQVITLTGVAQGMARVVSNSDLVACAAFVLDSALNPPASMSGLTE
ncbi:MAG: hypothetical protein A3J75_04035 [Acidobacteria bacterium RBG_16_68_9]|nr:MAG: hypothetical protein A3J75_04035 [Acidobacteria bacterium RBG_16_68_9]